MRKCLNCRVNITEAKFCSHSCAATYNNSRRKVTSGTKVVACEVCAKPVTINKHAPASSAKFECCQERRSSPRNKVRKTKCTKCEIVQVKLRPRQHKATAICNSCMIKLNRQKKERCVPKKKYPKLALKLSKVYGEEIRILGPYTCKSAGRKLIDVFTSSGKKKTCQLARARLEVKLDRKLCSGEEVDHIDEDHTNDSYSNLQLLTGSANARKSARHIAVVANVECLWCKRKFTITSGLSDRRRSKAGPFCSRRCSGKYGASIQNGGVALGKTDLPAVYTKGGKTTVRM